MKLPDIETKPSDPSEIYYLSDPSVLVSDQTVALSNVNQDVPYPRTIEACMLNGKLLYKGELEMLF